MLKLWNFGWASYYGMNQLPSPHPNRRSCRSRWHVSRHWSWLLATSCGKSSQLWPLTCLWCCFRNVSDIDFVLWFCIIPNTYYMILCNTYHFYIYNIIYLYKKFHSLTIKHNGFCSNKIVHSQTGYDYSNVCNLSIICPFFSINLNDDPINVPDPPRILGILNHLHIG